MKKGEIYEGIVEKTEFPNKGIVTVEDRRVAVKNTLPGQKIRFRLKKVWARDSFFRFWSLRPMRLRLSVPILQTAADVPGKICPTKIRGS